MPSSFEVSFMILISFFEIWNGYTSSNAPVGYLKQGTFFHRVNVTFDSSMLYYYSSNAKDKYIKKYIKMYVWTVKPSND